MRKALHGRPCPLLPRMRGFSPQRDSGLDHECELYVGRDLGNTDDIDLAKTWPRNRITISLSVMGHY
jgi:hypothetical protein